MGWVSLFVIVVFLGALAGGDSFGQVVRGGIYVVGKVVSYVLAAIVGVVLVYYLLLKPPQLSEKSEHILKWVLPIGLVLGFVILGVGLFWAIEESLEQKKIKKMGWERYKREQEEKKVNRKQ